MLKAAENEEEEEVEFLRGDDPAELSGDLREESKELGT